MPAVAYATMCFILATQAISQLAVATIPFTVASHRGRIGEGGPAVRHYNLTVVEYSSSSG